MAFCTECGHQVGPGMPACPSCGAAMAGPPPAAPAPPQQQWAPQAYQAPPPPTQQQWQQQAPAPVAPVPQQWQQQYAAPPQQQVWQGQQQAYPPPQGYAPPGPPGPNALGDISARTGAVLDRLLDDIRSFNLKWVVPFDTAVSPQIIKNRNVWVMLFFGFFPLTLAMMAQMKTIQSDQQFLTALTTYYCMAWAGYFYYFVCKQSSDFKIGVGVMAFTAFIGIPLLLAAQGFPPGSMLYSFLNRNDLVSQLIGYVFGVGIFEEVTKAAPVLIVAYGLKKMEKPLDGIFFGAMSGLGFAITEGAGYIGQQESAAGTVFQQLIRTTTLPFMHALWSATVGYFIALSLINKRRALALILLGLAVAAVHHGLYDTFAGAVPVLGLALAGFLYLLFTAYMERSQNMVAELHQAEAAAAEQQMREQVWIQYAQQTGYMQSIPVQAGYPAAPPQQQQQNPPTY